MIKSKGERGKKKSSIWGFTPKMGAELEVGQPQVLQSFVHTFHMCARTDIWATNYWVPRALAGS